MPKKELTPDQKAAKKAKRLARLAKKNNDTHPSPSLTSHPGTSKITYTMMKCSTPGCEIKTRVGSDVASVLCHHCTMASTGACFEKPDTIQPENN